MVVYEWKDKTSGQTSLDGDTLVCTDMPNIKTIEIISEYTKVLCSPGS